MSSAPTVAVLGYGYWGPNLVRNLRSLPDCRVHAVCDADPTRREHLVRTWPDIQPVSHADELFADPAVDAVLIATPADRHFKHAHASLTAGKHTFVEKPMSTSAAESDALVRLASDAGRTLMVGHTYLYSAPLRWIAETVAAGEIGEIRYVNARRLNLGLFQDTHNVAWDLAPHDLSIILHLLGEMPRVVNCQGNAHVTPGVEDVSNLSLTFSGGRFATIQSSWLEPRKVREMTIVGTRKMIVYNDLEPLEKVRVYDVRVERPPHADTFAQFLYSYHYGASYAPHIEQEEPLRAECRHFLECITTGATPLTDGISGHRVVRVLEAASESLRLGGAPVALAA